LISEIILSSLLSKKPFARKVLPHIKDDYFESIEKKTLFNLIKNYIVQYKGLPTAQTLKLELTKNDKLSESGYSDMESLINEVSTYESDYDTDWLVDNTEEWCKERALHNAILESVTLIQEKQSTGGIPELVRQALQVEFDTSIGIEFLDKSGIDSRWEDYQRKDIKFSTGIQALDNVTAGGLEQKSLSCIMAGCVTKNTLVTLRHKITGNIINVPIINLIL
jgi:replicative DNA helicase